MIVLISVSLVIFFTKSIFCFNLDTNNPIIYTDPFMSSSRSSYFGYSIILHRNLSINDDVWIQIGAPRGKILEADEKEPGLAYRCNIFGPCATIDVDKHSASYHQDSINDIVDGAWIGGAMDIDSPSGRTVICGHRWINSYSNSYLMQGACYWSHVNDTKSVKLLPLVNKANIVIKIQGINVYYYGQGQAGMSAHLPNSHDQLVLGAPGVLNWEGTVLRYRDGDSQIPIASKYQKFKRATLGANEFTNLNIANANLTGETAAFGLFGYSMTSGYFFDKFQLLYASGAPRAKYYNGEVLVYNFAEDYNERLYVRDAKQGLQFGEYFGASLTAGDINMDGFDDLVVGAPFYENNKYNQGRIFIYLGSQKGRLDIPTINEIIEGDAIGGQFGLSLMFLGDLDSDGYSDIAVGAPYENNGVGVVYIYNGNKFGLNSKFSQRLVGSEFVPTIKGFGISISKPSDIDDNYYNDVAIGAYITKHVVLLRNRPTVILMHSLMSFTPQLSHNAEQFNIRPCFWYAGYRAPPTISISRIIKVDKMFERASLAAPIPTEGTLTLYANQYQCQNFTVLIKPNITNRYNPITISISESLITEPEMLRKIYVDHHSELNRSRLDFFCKTCPIYHPEISFKEEVISLPFVRGCGDDDICHSNLILNARFLNIGQDNNYVLGTPGYLKLHINVRNDGEKAYQTQVIIELPNSVYFHNNPPFCSDIHKSNSLICNVENPLYEYTQKSVTLELDTRAIDTVRYGDTLNFTITVVTTSQNSNYNSTVLQLHIEKEADLALIGKSSQTIYSYGNETNGKPNFTHIFQVEKLGLSPIEEVKLIILVPISLYHNQWIQFAQLYRPTGLQGSFPIYCKSNENYLLENNLASILDENDKISSPAKRSIDDQEESINHDNTFQNETKVEFEYSYKRIFYLNCSDKNIMCAEIKCSIGPFTNKMNTAKLELKVLLDVNALKTIMGSKDIIMLTTEGSVIVKSPPNFVQTGQEPDNVKIATIFVGDSLKGSVELWIIIVAVVVGLLLLILVIFGLRKAGFFRRTNKDKLEALIEAEEEHFNSDTHVHEQTQEFDDNISDDIKQENLSTK